MQEIRYLDLYFLWNFAADGLCLYLVLRILPRAPKLWRLTLSGALGALYACAVEYFAPPVSLSLPAFLILLPLSLFLALGKTPVKTFLRALIFYPLTLCLLGGALYGAAALIGLSASGADFNFLFLLILTLCALLFLFFYLFSLVRAAKAKICTVKLTLFGKTHTCAALCDSANFLTDPDSGLCVILAGAAFARRALPEESEASDFIPIPFQSAAGDGVCYGYRVQTLVLCRGAKKIPLPEAILAANHSVRDFAGCELLLPAGYTDVSERKRVC